MSLNLFFNFPIVKRVLYSVAQKRIKTKVKQISKYLKSDESVLDIGCGNCLITSALRERGNYVVSLDVENHSFIKEIDPIIYDGKNIPFEDNQFDSALLITMLHHTPDPEGILLEAGRVASKLIVIEEIYSSRWQKYWTFFVDSLFNFEFFGHPHKNKTDSEWRDIFRKFNFMLVESKKSHVFPALNRVIYVLKA